MPTKIKYVESHMLPPAGRDRAIKGCCAADGCLNGEQGFPLQSGRSIIALLRHDSDWCFACWAVSAADRKNHKLSDRERHLIVYRFLDHEDCSIRSTHIDIKVSSLYGSWHILLDIPGHYFFAEFGYYNEDGVFVVLAGSQVIHSIRSAVINSVQNGTPPGNICIGIPPKYHLSIHPVHCARCCRVNPYRCSRE
ncbi:MAG: DUF4912 domain-containing protein [Spirochaetes bacterium]|nr:DUF4912 domain-containing protein [Spirochaetota bacterium]